MAKKQPTKLSPAAINALRAAVFTRNALRLTEENLECYAEIKALVETLGGKWVSRTKLHEFGEGVDARALVIACCDRGEIPPTNKHDFFPTKADVVTAMVEDRDFSSQWEARITCAEMDSQPIRYLEPSGGAGALVEPMYLRLRPQDELVVCEINPLLAAALRARFPRATVIEGDFLQFTSAEKFDVVLMNPPFDRTAYQKHVAHAFSLLQRRGILAAIVPSGFHQCVEFARWVYTNGCSADLGQGRFADTAIGTSVLWLSNDPQNAWRDQECQGFTSWHAWNASTAISSDGAVLQRLARCAGFAEQLAVLTGWADQLVQSEDSCQRMDAAIAREILPQFADYLPAVERDATARAAAPETFDDAADLETAERLAGEIVETLSHIEETAEPAEAQTGEQILLNV